MSLFQNTSGEIRDIDPDLMAAWLAAGNPKANGWTAYTPPPEPEVQQVPQKVTARQAKSALLMTGWLGSTDEAVEANGYALFDQLPEPNRSLGRIAWRESNDFERDNSWIVAMLAVLGKTKAQGDAVFIDALRF